MDGGSASILQGTKTFFPNHRKTVKTFSLCAHNENPGITRNSLNTTLETCVLHLCGHGNKFVTTEPKFVYLKSPGVKFMNYFTDLKNPLLKSFGSYKVEWVKW